MPYNELLRGRHSVVFQEYLVTTVCQQRRPVFLVPEHAESFQQEVCRLEADGEVEWLAWMLMPDHFHALLRLISESSLPRVMRLLKGRTAYRIGGPLWQKGFHDHALREEEDRLATARYLLGNPMRTGITRALRDYPYWYCSWLEPGDDPDEFLLD